MFAEEREGEREISFGYRNLVILGGSIPPTILSEVEEL